MWSSDEPMSDGVEKPSDLGFLGSSLTSGLSMLDPRAMMTTADDEQPEQPSVPPAQTSGDPNEDLTDAPPKASTRVAFRHLLPQLGKICRHARRA